MNKVNKKNQKSTTVRAVRMHELESDEFKFVYRYECSNCGRKMTLHTDEKPKSLPKCFDCCEPLQGEEEQE